MKIKTFVLSFLYSATTFILVVYISVSYNYNRINRFGLRENVKKINVTSLAPTDLDNRVDNKRNTDVVPTNKNEHNLCS
ncbi:hypothetical protein AOC36_01195 [Erysipelothrix larvae]|uniref:Uncharacterized protein n=1 Tax=Erysipelothrix larvae TaxID=1514105 RepID=A0A120JTE8_9FIRM|nr:hypothetical protein AOC36_01195 [Erysipelothrix larvae]